MEKSFHFINMILEGPFKLQLAWAMIFLFLLSSILMAFIFSLIFNYFIIVKIEKRLGIKISKWGTLIEMFPFKKPMTKYIIVSSLVVYQYFFIIFFKKPDVLIKEFNRKRAWAYDLAKANYDVRDAPRYEVVLSFLVMASFFIWIFAVTIMLVFLK